MLSRTVIEKYFIAEKQIALAFVIIGIVAIIIALLGWLLWKTPAWKGAAIPLMITGCIQLAAGYTVYQRSDAQRVANVYAFDMNPGQLKQKELPRMQQVTRRFPLYQAVEIILALAGIALFVLYRNNAAKQLLSGLGLALCIQAIIMLGADFFAAKRARDYTNDLSNFVTHQP
ncbi:hypothetical protein [Deminuibacter soli]|uniref:Uncharacterized protein n=1 Tax=Deminuibacter soli TaxID=2291815 RepID=A0A3E1NR41_9BACT|nr:hypothetical protein [Deminuibacter soli]RFM30402.1 hypothetical protein DXN05_05455 [Deminuibacter soli]